jgi:hypothetical protein
MEVGSQAQVVHMMVRAEQSFEDYQDDEDLMR